MGKNINVKKYSKLKKCIIITFIIMLLIFISYILLNIINYSLICSFKEPILITSKKQENNTTIYYGIGYKITKTFDEDKYNREKRERESQNLIYHIGKPYNISYTVFGIKVLHKTVFEDEHIVE